MGYHFLRYDFMWTMYGFWFNRQVYVKNSVQYLCSIITSNRENAGVKNTIMMQCIDVNGNASLPIECGNDFKIGSKMKFSFDMKTMDIGKIIIWQVLDSTGNDIQNTWHLDSIQLVDNSYISLDGIHVSTLWNKIIKGSRILNKDRQSFLIQSYKIE